MTRGGTAVPFISHDEGSATDCCVLARKEGQTQASFYSINGILLGWKESAYDLFMAPKKREAWVNVCDQRCMCSVYDTKEDADAAAITYQVKRITCCRIEWEE